MTPEEEAEIEREFEIETVSSHAILRQRMRKRGYDPNDDASIHAWFRDVTINAAIKQREMLQLAAEHPGEVAEQIIATVTAWRQAQKELAVIHHERNQLIFDRIQSAKRAMGNDRQ